MGSRGCGRSVTLVQGRSKAPNGLFGEPLPFSSRRDRAIIAQAFMPGDPEPTTAQSRRDD
jgi:hypothetical protein